MAKSKDVHVHEKHDREMSKVLTQWGRGLSRWEYLHSDNFRGGVELNGFSVRPPTAERAEWLVVLRGWDDAGAPVVGFHSASTCADAVSGASERVSNGTIKWKDDAYRS